MVHKPVNSECSRRPAARSANGLLTDHSAVAFERGQAFDAVRVSVDRFCLLAGIEALQELMEEDVASLCGPVHRHDAARTAYRWGTTVGELGYHGGKVKVPATAGYVILPARKRNCRAGFNSERDNAGCRASEILAPSTVPWPHMGAGQGDISRPTGQNMGIE